MTVQEPQALCERIASDFSSTLRARSIASYPDSRGVGGAVQAELLYEWDELCAGWGGTAEPAPGPKTMYDGAFTLGGAFVGVDFTAKRSGEEGYSDGGVCSVADLLRFYVRTSGLFLIAQVRYSQGQGKTTVDNVTTAPLHSLPLQIFSIANLGTGQVRLSEPLDRCKGQIDWNRDTDTFLTEFAEVAKGFYATVAQQASQRSASVQAMVESRFESIRIK